ncbi:MAG: gamma-glutamyl-gamma-aminobutyrate hydrolase [Euryarchaeota archaeon]|nr:gamma-glutamyl-gamma-aminobutyrate hydrolase [Euryarchaeota archaeon]
MRPVIGITCFMRETVVTTAFGDWERHAAVLPSAYVSVIKEAGGTPLIIPPAGDMTPILDSIDGLLISGGPDLDPSTYNEERSEMTKEFFREQDEAEMGLINGALDKDMPILGICRGMQILSVAHGGSMHQHLDTTPGHEGHGAYDGGTSNHGIDIVEGSLLSDLMGTSFIVNSAHHQGVSDPGSLSVSATAEHDGLIEAVERKDKQFCIGVQWHPERMEQGFLFSKFVEAARG